MYKIGEFSYLCKVTLKTLRHYDKIGLLKPIKIDDYTGYRYYEDKQIKILKNIKELQQAGFKLSEIKELLDNPNKKLIAKKLEEIKLENSKKINILQKIEKNMSKEEKSNKKISVIENQDYYIVGVTKRISNRTKIEKILNEVDKKVKLDKFKIYPKIFCNYESSYKEKDISCFIGRKIPVNEETDYALINQIKSKNIEVYAENKVKKHIRCSVENNILKTYQDIIKFANKNKLEIFNGYTEIYNEGKIEIDAACFNKDEINKDTLEYYQYLSKKIKDIYSKEYVGTWQLQGEITEPPKLFNPRKKHFIPNAKLKTIILNEDGTTNFKHIIWKENYLIQNFNGDIAYNRFYITKKGLNQYLFVFANTTYKTRMPYELYYKKVK